MADTRTEPQLYREPELEAEPPPLKTKPAAAPPPLVDRVKQGAQATSEPDAALVRPTKPTKPIKPSKPAAASGAAAGDITGAAASAAADPLPDEVLKRRLLNRIAIAAVLVVGLLGSLAMFDALYRPAVKSPPAVAVLTPKEDATPAPPQPIGKEAEAPTAPSLATSSVATTTQSVATTTAAVALPTPTPATKPPLEAPKTAPAAPPAAIPPLAEKPLTRPATARPAVAYPTEPLPPLASPQARPDATRELPKTPALAAPPPAKAATIAPPPVAPPAAIFAPPTPIAAPRLTIQGEGRFFALQMGVFSNMANAEDMRAKLELHGIPTTVETRIHVGPFKTRAEADAARVKLRELGLDGGLLITMRK